MVLDTHYPVAPNGIAEAAAAKIMLFHVLRRLLVKTIATHPPRAVHIHAVTLIDSHMCHFSRLSITEEKQITSFNAIAIHSCATVRLLGGSTHYDNTV